MTILVHDVWRKRLPEFEGNIVFVTRLSHWSKHPSEEHDGHFMPDDDEAFFYELSITKDSQRWQEINWSCCVVKQRYLWFNPMIFVDIMDTNHCIILQLLLIFAPNSGKIPMPSPSKYPSRTLPSIFRIYNKILSWYRCCSVISERYASDYLNINIMIDSWVSTEAWHSSLDHESLPGYSGVSLFLIHIYFFSMVSVH